jgi:prepilin signal peptidase PulO-like enzyme (type II secretory pathway)
MTSPAVAALCGTLLAAAIDGRTGIIPDSVTRSTALAALTLAAVNGAAPAAASGACAVGGMLWALHLVSRGRGLGLGDVKLGIAIGAGLGPLAGAVAVGAAFVLGAAYAIALLATHRAHRGDAIAFGPFLAAGTLAVTLVPGGALR